LTFIGQLFKCGAIRHKTVFLTLMYYYTPESPAWEVAISIQKKQKRPAKAFLLSAGQSRF
jgi:hypothetical protein